jgi:hypothetical protein
MGFGTIALRSGPTLSPKEDPAGDCQEIQPTRKLFSGVRQRMPVNQESRGGTLDTDLFLAGAFPSQK